MASQILASVTGMSACTTPNEASASTTEASCGVSQQTRTCARRSLRAHPPLWRRFLLPTVTGFVTQIWGFCALLMDVIES
jgi:hypothetical protein